MFKKKLRWTLAGVLVGTVTTIMSHNPLAGLFIGCGTGMLLLILTNLETNNRKSA